VGAPPGNFPLGKKSQRDSPKQTTGYFEFFAILFLLNINNLF